jgi:hypothetical protein
MSVGDTRIHRVKSGSARSGFSAYHQTRPVDSVPKANLLAKIQQITA